jgi:CheY-like chemotaxis protein
MRNNPTILITDDDPDDLLFLVESLESRSTLTRCIKKKNGREALDHLRIAKEKSTLPDLVVLDVNMPLMSGIEVLSAMKKESGLRDLPVAVMTTSPSEKDNQVCSDHGVKLLQKPTSAMDYYNISRILLELIAR